MTTQRVLLVDDDRDVREAYMRVLRERAPLQAADGVAARKILSETQIDVVVCDLEMPGMSGLDLMQWGQEHCAHTSWIVVSGEGTFDAAIQAIKLGAFDFLRKPVAPIELQIAVTNALVHQAFVAERVLFTSALAENNLRLSESHRKLEIANTECRNQQTMLDQDLQRAERIVRALLPHALHPLERIQVNVVYRPSKSIGGDFYGATMLDDRHLAVYVADAAGHGVSAALLAVLFDQRLSLLNTEPGLRSPATVLGDLNRGLIEECRASGLFVTVAYALIDTKTRTATIASAGHPPCILLRETGISEHFDKTGPALGLAADASFGEHRISLAEGDRLLLYTDGLTGAISEHAPSLDAILASVAAGVEDGGHVMDSLLTWTNDEHADDMTLLLLTANTGASTIDADDHAHPRSIPPANCGISVGSEQHTTWVAVRGRVIWTDAAVLRDSCIEALDAGRGVIIDLASCISLDSTMLGTLHELVVRAASRGSLRLQNVGAPIGALFAELAMTDVLSDIMSNPRPTPANMVELRPKDDGAAVGLVLHAHELLAQLSASNAAQFQPVVDLLRETRA
jgi:serine phosphatase RsbU (regulator of sigma subunit)